MTKLDTIAASPAPASRRGRIPIPGTLVAQRKLCIRFGIVIVVVMSGLAGHAAVASATCNDDCKNEYVSSLNECRAQYEQGKDLQDLEECLADTRSEYDDCIDDCTSLGAGGVMACAPGAGGLKLTGFSASTARQKAQSGVKDNALPSFYLHR